MRRLPRRPSIRYKSNFPACLSNKILLYSHFCGQMLFLVMDVVMTLLVIFVKMLCFVV